MKKLVLKNVTKRFGQVVAVNGVDLDIDDQEFIVLVGPSGCGKTTALRMIAGLEEIDEGEIYINDQLVNDVPPKARDIAMVFQSYALYPHMTVSQNMAFSLKMRKIPKDERVLLVNEAANILGIEELLDRKPRQLSGGQRQRVALGRAIVRKPEVFLFDEPLSNLDAKLRVQMRTELKKLHQRLQATIVYVTHDQVEAMTMGDRIVIMKEGTIQQIGTPLRLYNRPKNIFVAGFVGSPAMNFMRCRIKEEKAQFFMDTGDFRLQLTDRIVEKVRAAAGQEFTFGVRPEDFRERRSDSASPYKGRIKATVEVVETLGRELFLDLSSGEHSLTAIVGADTSVRPKTEIELEINMEKIHLFHIETGEAVV
jgi:multiple sugar transport system ATP-binding protein